jgi:hypothetical protein
MSQENPVPPTDAAAGPEVEDVVRTPPRAVLGRGRSVENWLLIIVLLVTIVFIGAAGSLVLYVLSMRDAPRTAPERQIGVDEVASDQRSAFA